jgi:hypothetical protein
MGGYQRNIVAHLRTALAGEGCDVEVAKKSRDHALRELETIARLDRARRRCMKLSQEVQVRLAVSDLIWGVASC